MDDDLYFDDCDRCSDYNQLGYYGFWCQNCNRKRLQQNFDKWTSGNKYIDELIQEAQLKAEKSEEVIEWIPYDRLSDIKYFDKGGFSTIYKAFWSDGPIIGYRNEWLRDYCRKDVILKSLNNSSNINNDFLNELKNHLHMSSEQQYRFVRIYGITKDPETSNYMIVMRLINGGNVRSNLLIKKYNPFEKYHDLWDIATALSTLHENNLVHCDFHSGNILISISNYFVTNFYYITDFGLSRPANETKSNEIYGVIPYMAPEVLRGKPYTKAADIYSFGIIMWEFTSGIPAFNNIPHDFNLSLRICKGLRPKIIEGTLPVYARLMKRCWDNDPNKRPTADELLQIIEFWYDYYPRYSFFDPPEKRIPIPKNVSIAKNHPLSCYISRKIDYSERLNKTLAQEELSCKIIVEEEKEYTLLSESLENCLISK